MGSYINEPFSVIMMRMEVPSLVNCINGSRIVDLINALGMFLKRLMVTSHQMNQRMTSLDHVEGALPGQLHQRVAQICAQVAPPITEPYAQPLGRLYQQTTQPDHDENGGTQLGQMNQ